MSTWIWILIAVAAVVVLALVYFSARRAQVRRVEEKRGRGAGSSDSGPRLKRGRLKSEARPPTRWRSVRGPTNRKLSSSASARTRWIRTSSLIPRGIVLRATRKRSRPPRANRCRGRASEPLVRELLEVGDRRGVPVLLQRRAA